MIYNFSFILVRILCYIRQKEQNKIINHKRVMIMKKYATLAVWALGFVSMSGAFMQSNAASSNVSVNDTIVNDSTEKTSFNLNDTVVTDTAEKATPAFALNDTVVNDTVAKA